MNESIAQTESRSNGFLTPNHHNLHDGARNAAAIASLTNEELSKLVTDARAEIAKRIASAHELAQLFGQEAPVARTPARAKPATHAPAKRVAKGVKTGGRLPRRTDEQIAQGVKEIVALLAKHPDGLRSEQIREMTGRSVKELPALIKAAIESKQARSKGQKRATTYYSK